MGIHYNGLRDISGAWYLLDAVRFPWGSRLSQDSIQGLALQGEGMQLASVLLHRLLKRPLLLIVNIQLCLQEQGCFMEQRL